MKRVALILAVVLLLVLGATALAACTICGGDGICDICRGTGYISSLNKTCVCNNGKCPVCNTTTLYSSSSRTFELNSRLSGYRGRYTVSWTDSSNAGPYEVGRTYCGTGSATQGYFYANNGSSDSTTYGNSLTLNHLIPGESYIIDVIDKNGVKIQRTYTVPYADSFVDGKLKASSVDITIKPAKYNSSTGKTVKLSELKANDIMNGIDYGDSFGVSYQIDFPRLASDREFFAQLAFYAPNGFSHTEYADDISYSSFSNASGSYSRWDIIGQNFFRHLYNKNGYVPTGEYRVELYWDGMHVNTSTFRVK
ncbi:MAG: hypothetical protein IKU34_02620 [Clostridia bacterium]|nr:hypothetical protein [Clostridia bacterium]